MKMVLHYIKAIVRRLTLSNLENLIYCNWFNPFATLYLNLRVLPLNHALRFPILVFGCPRFYDLSGDVKIEGKVRAGMITFNRTNSLAPSFQNVNSELTLKGELIFSGGGYNWLRDKDLYL